MAKKSVRTNAFGMTPDSFDTTKMKLETEENTIAATPEAPAVPAPTPAVEAPKVEAPKTVQPAAASEQGKREYKKIGRDKVRVHFLASARLLARVDACAEKKDRSRTLVIQEAIEEYLEREGY